MNSIPEGLHIPDLKLEKERKKKGTRRNKLGGPKSAKQEENVQ